MLIKLEYKMTFINFIRNILEYNESFPYNFQFVINDKVLSFLKE